MTAPSHVAVLEKLDRCFIEGTPTSNALRAAIAQMRAPVVDGALTDAQCDAIYSALDSWARDVDSYDFGLPMVAGGGNVTAREVIRTAMQEAGK